MAPKRALICEDDGAIRALVKTVVRREGFDVDEAADGRVAIDKIRTDCFDLVILDLMMPEVDGYAVVDFLKERGTANLKRVIVMTAATGAIKEEFPAPICTLLPKPFDIDQLTSAVRHCARECDGVQA